MLRKIFTFVLAAAATCGISAFAQQPAPAEKEAPQTLEFSFAGGGSYLGVYAKNVSSENMAQFGLSRVQGVAIEKIVEGSPAEKAGLMNGDVIVSFNGEKITSVRKLTRLVREVAPEHTVRIEVLRNGDQRTFDVTLAKRPMPAFSEGQFTFEGARPFPQLPALPEAPNVAVVPPESPEVLVWAMGSRRQLGVSVTALTKQLGEYFGVADGEGVLITRVREDSPAAQAGLRAGDVIVEIDGEKIGRSSDLVRRLNKAQEGAVNLTIVRDRNRQTLSVTPEKVEGGVFDGRLQRFFERAPGRQMRLRSKPPKAPRSPAAPIIVRGNDARVL